jgi:hypothetical protein
MFALARLPGLAQLGVLLLLCSGVGCALQSSTAPKTTFDSAAEVAALLSGSYSSQRQAQADPNFYDVRLFMQPIWPERSGEHWLYVEQAMASALDKPYRQRVYRIEAASDGGAISHVYTLPGDPLRFAGAHLDPGLLSQFSAADLQERKGCAIHLRRQTRGGYIGSTHASDCPSDLRGASYATSEVELSEHLLSSWDRGYDEQDTQVWGAVSGPYRFDRLADKAGSD